MSVYLSGRQISWIYERVLVVDFLYISCLKTKYKKRQKKMDQFWQSLPCSLFIKGPLIYKPDQMLIVVPRLLLVEWNFCRFSLTHSLSDRLNSQNFTVFPPIKLFSELKYLYIPWKHLCHLLKKMCPQKISKDYSTYIIWVKGLHSVKCNSTVVDILSDIYK